MVCDTVCSEHSGLETSIKWLTRILLVGFTLVLSMGSYSYINNQEIVATMNTNVIEMNTNIAELRQDVSDLGYTIKERSQSHEYSLEKLTAKVDATEVLCCPGDD